MGTNNSCHLNTDLQENNRSKMLKEIEKKVIEMVKKLDLEKCKNFTHILSCSHEQDGTRVLLEVEY